jgi:hypothetical protein
MMSLLFGLVIGETAHAQTDTRACAADAVMGQRARRIGRFAESLDAFARCRSDSCPEEIRSDCATWFEATRVEVRTLLFDVVPLRARGLEPRLVPEGKDAQVTFDGEPQHSGVSRPVDWGEHRYAISVGHARYERVIAVGPTSSKHTAIRVLVAPDSQASGSALGPAMGVGLAVAGVIGAATSFMLLLLHRADASDLSMECGPSCPASLLDARENRGLAIGVSLGVSTVALMTGLVLALWPRESR